jgi:hypothetical protein
MTGWVSGNLVGFAWNVPQAETDADKCKPDARQDDTKCFPYVWVEILDQGGLNNCTTGACIVAKPHIFRSDTAFQYPSIIANERGDLGFVALYGGGAYRQGCAVGTRSADLLTTEAGWKLTVPAQSKTNPRDSAAGDYMDISRGPAPNSFVAACVSVGGSGTGQTPSDVHFAYFGQRMDQP